MSYTPQQTRYKIIDQLRALYGGMNTGGSIISLLKQVAYYNKVSLEDVTDEMILAWCKRESEHIYQMCWGSVLNG